jgi:hypothetical protein
MEGRAPHPQPDGSVIWGPLVDQTMRAWGFHPNYATNNWEHPDGRKVGEREAERWIWYQTHKGKGPCPY